MVPGIIGVALLLAIAARPLSAQDSTHLLIGIAGGYDRGTTSGIMPVYDDAAGCGELGNGRNESWRLGGYMILPSSLADDIGLSFGLSLARTDFQYSSAADPVWTAIDTLEITSLREYHLDGGMTSLNLDLLLTATIFDRFMVRFGPSLSYRFNSLFSQSDVITGETEASFANGQRTITMSGGERFTAAPFGLGGVLSAGYSLPISARFSLLLEATAHADLLSAVRESDWRSLSVGGGIGVLFDASEHESPIPPVPPPPVPPEQAAATLRDSSRNTSSDNTSRDIAFRDNTSRRDTSRRISDQQSLSPPAIRTTAVNATLDFYSMDESGRRRDTAVVVIHEVELRREFPMAPMLLKRDAAPHGKSIRLTRNEARRFIIDSLASRPDAEVRRHMLNVIGARLKSNQGAIIRLIELPADAEMHTLATGVQSYLRDVWGIASQRVVIDRSRASADTGICGGRPGLLLASDDPAIVASLSFDDTEREIESPVVRLEPLYSSDVGLRRWDVTLLHGDHQIMRQTSDQAGDKASQTMDWRFLDERPEVRYSDFRVEFHVEDSTGANDTIRQSLPLLVERYRWLVTRTVKSCDGSVRTIYTVPKGVWNSERGHRDLITDVVRSRGEDGQLIVAGGEIGARTFSEQLMSAGHGISIHTIPSDMLRRDPSLVDSYLPGTIVVVLEE
jgi:hypothetical protein